MSIVISKKNKRLTREDWIHGGLEFLGTAGVGGVRIVPLARRLGVTSGSFYWHFANRAKLYEALLDYWETEMTDAAIDAARKMECPPKERIWSLMKQVMSTGLAKFDLAIWHWAQTHEAAQTSFQRTLEKRFIFATWMFKEAGFSKTQAEIRGRMMVVYMMGESSLISEKFGKREKQLRLKFEILTNS
jgi:AcrR family transcriptional regulator